MASAAATAILNWPAAAFVMVTVNVLTAASDDSDAVISAVIVYPVMLIAVPPVVAVNVRVQVQFSRTVQVTYAPASSNVTVRAIGTSLPESTCRSEDDRSDEDAG